MPRLSYQQQSRPYIETKISAGPRQEDAGAFSQVSGATQRSPSHLVSADPSWFCSLADHSDYSWFQKIISGPISLIPLNLFVYAKKETLDYDLSLNVCTVMFANHVWVHSVHLNFMDSSRPTRILQTTFY